MRYPVVAEHRSLWIALAILFFLLVSRASAMEVLLTTQQPFILDGNTTLVIEDSSSTQGVIWLKLYSRNETTDSAVMSLGEHLRYAGKNITLLRIYSGGDSDLVTLKIENVLKNSSKAYGNASQRSMAAPAESQLQRYLPSFLALLHSQHPLFVS